MEKDVVCGMQVDPAKAAGSSEYNGKTYYFCSKGARRSSRRTPANSPNSARSGRLCGHAVVLNVAQTCNVDARAALNHWRPRNVVAFAQ